MVDRNAQALTDQLLALPVPDRARLAGLLLASLEEVDADAVDAWDVEIARRAQELDAGHAREYLQPMYSLRRGVDCNGDRRLSSRSPGRIRRDCRIL